MSISRNGTCSESLISALKERSSATVGLGLGAYSPMYFFPSKGMISRFVGGVIPEVKRVPTNNLVCIFQEIMEEE